MRKKILYITQLFPYPPHSGGRIKTLQTIKSLSGSFDIILVCFSSERISPQYRQRIKRYVTKDYCFIGNNVGKTIRQNIPLMVKNYLRGIPQHVYEYAVTEAQTTINKIIATVHPDIIHIDHINMAQYLPKKKGQTWILEEHNIEHRLLLSRFPYTRGVTRKISLLCEVVLTYLFEWRWISRFDWTFTISEVDNNFLRSILHVNKVTTQPVVYINKQNQSLRRNHKVPTLLFIGDLFWPPNRDAVEWFVRSIYRQIQGKIPNVQFDVVGERNPDLQKKLSDIKGVHFHGYKKDIDIYLTQADVFILPFRIGGGVRIKALTAFSSGVPVVSTSKGVEGLRVHHKHECYIADNPIQFASSTVMLLENCSLRQRLVKQAAIYLQQTHGKKQEQSFRDEYARVSQKFL